MTNQNAVRLHAASLSTAPTPAHDSPARPKPSKALVGRLARLNKIRDLLTADIADAWAELGDARGSRADHSNVAQRIARVTKLQECTEAELAATWAELSMRRGEARV
jgi:hypothetical protein